MESHYLQKMGHRDTLGLAILVDDRDIYKYVVALEEDHWFILGKFYYYDNSGKYVVCD